MVADPKIALIGSVNSSAQTLRKLVQHQLNIVHVLGLHPSKSAPVSGYRDIKVEAENLGVEASYFNNVNDQDVYETLKNKKVDLLFIIGLSQMVKEPLLSLATIGNVGFHPTKLPEGRGRAALAWIVLEKAKGAASFFLLDEGMDSGPILGQQAFEISEDDYAADVLEKIKSSIDVVLDSVLPDLRDGVLKVHEQEHEKATFLGVRRPKDGEINWRQTSNEVRKLIRATSIPLPGAYTTYQGQKLIVWRAKELKQYTGVPGRIIDIKDNKPIVCCENGALLLEEIKAEKTLDFKIGKDFGTYD
jgi:methionyl-tRNA formyltransferase